MATVERPTSIPTSDEVPHDAPVEVRAPLRDERFRGGEAGTRWKFTVDEYYRMAEAGILRSDDRVELLDGDVIVISPIGSHHGSVSKRLNALLQQFYGGRAIISPADPVHLDDHSEPQPDYTLLRPRDDFYRSAHPTQADVYLTIEIMDSSARYDRGKKLAKYARSGLAEVWLVDIGRERIEVYRSPNGEDYDEKRTLARGESLTPEAFPDSALDVAAILG
jgi:Uma2 family endonuclease